jgi:hypothetical protein
MEKMEPEKKLPAPPYVAYKTLKNFLDRFQQGIPGRIDRGLMGSMSGAVQSQVKTTLRNLGLISEHDIPLDPMKRLCTAEDLTRQKELRGVLESAYPYIFGPSGIDFSTATGSQIREAIEKNTTASGETLSRCMAFLKDAAKDAGIPVSPYFGDKSIRNGSSGRKQRNATTRKPKNPDITEPPDEVHHPESETHQKQRHVSPQADAQSSLLLWGLFQRLPKPGSVWPKADRDHWVKTLENVFMLEYREQG